MLKNKKFLLFDLDGVLVDTREIHFKAFQRSLLEHGINLTKDEHSEKFDGLPTSSKLEILSKNHNLNSNQTKSIDELKQLHTISFLNELLAEDKELICLLEVLKKKYHMCVCSNARKETIDLTVKLLGLFPFMDFTISQEEVKKPKQDPSIYLEAIAKFSAQKAECLIFEDSPHGIQAAVNSGIDFIKINHASHLKDTLRIEILK